MFACGLCALVHFAHCSGPRDSLVIRDCAFLMFVTFFSFRSAVASSRLVLATSAHKLFIAKPHFHSFYGLWAQIVDARHAFVVWMTSANQPTFAAVVSRRLLVVAYAWFGRICLCRRVCPCVCSLSHPLCHPFVLHGLVSLSSCLWLCFWWLQCTACDRPGRSLGQDLKVLATLPEILKSKLRDELFSPTLTKAPFMLVISAIDSHGMSGLCFKAVTEKSLVPKEELFVDGMVATKMYFLSAGAMEYVRKTGGVVATKENQQASEPALWMNWLHCGTLSATSHCEVLELDSKCFRAILLTHETSLPFLCRYALLFHKTVSHTKDWATDLWDRVLLQSLAETAGEKRSTRAEMKTKTVSAKAFRFLRRTSMKNTLK